MRYIHRRCWGSLRATITQAGCRRRLSDRGGRPARRKSFGGDMYLGAGEPLDLPGSCCLAATLLPSSASSNPGLTCRRRSRRRPSLLDAFLTGGWRCGKKKKKKGLDWAFIPSAVLILRRSRTMMNGLATPTKPGDGRGAIGPPDRWLALRSITKDSAPYGPTKLLISRAIHRARVGTATIVGMFLHRKKTCICFSSPSRSPTLGAGGLDLSRC